MDTFSPMPAEGTPGGVADGVDFDHDGLKGKAQPVERQAMQVGQDRLGGHTHVLPILAS